MTFSVALIVVYGLNDREFFFPRPFGSLCDNSDQQKGRVRSFGVRQLAAAFASASWLAARSRRDGYSREPARGEESGSKLPHSKAARSRPMETI